tara:strand:+ start:2064 stop:2717 length:654 start_codon:yes stop_codon:yes gene_type:complete
MTEYVISKSFSSRVDRTPRVLECAEAFGIGLANKEFVLYEGLKLEVLQGDVVYITGQSGSGKSQLLKELHRQMRTQEWLRVASLDEVQYDERPLIDQVGENMADAVRLLSMAGLNDAYLFVRSPSQLSDGQKYRFKLAKVIESGATVWVADEFGATLDRDTAKVVAFCLQKMAREAGATVLVATTHSDLEFDLNPTLVVTKHYENRVAVSTYPERRS